MKFWLQLQSIPHHEHKKIPGNLNLLKCKYAIMIDVWKVKSRIFIEFFLYLRFKVFKCGGAFTLLPPSDMHNGILRKISLCDCSGRSYAFFMGDKYVLQHVFQLIHKLNEAPTTNIITVVVIAYTIHELF